jgi:cyclopropane-fatty-acyl-phospholipid synthase
MRPADRLARAALRPLLRRGIKEGALLLVNPDGSTERFGAGEPTAIAEVRDPRAWGSLVHASRGLADAYVNGWWDSPDPVAVISLAARNTIPGPVARRAMTLSRLPAQWGAALARPQSRRRSRRDISAHYDLGNEFFARMLDPTMSYSAALYEEAATTLEEAQLAKLERICESLDLGPADHVVEIGGGWGSFAVHAAATRGCRVTTTTISREQHDLMAKRVKEAGLDDLVTVLLEDYRDLRGRYDKLVSVEMIEAVGWRHFGTFFRRCSELLEPHGAMLLQAITIDERIYAMERFSRSFIRTRVFPGGCLPSRSVIDAALARHTDMRIAGAADLTTSYAHTLASWRERFKRAAPELEELGYDKRFRRLWTMYLAYCEAGFRTSRIGASQILMLKPGSPLAGAAPREVAAAA